MEIQIKNIDGSVILSVIADDNAVYHEELMTSEYVKLSWQSDSGNVLPVGTYIEYEGEKYRLLEPYTPQQTDEATYSYTPQFQSRIMNWGKQIVPVYTYEDDGTTVKTREMDWEFTGSPADAMYIIKQAIKNETGEEWTVQLAENLPATITISAQSTTILAMLNNIATECDTEFWTDNKTNTLYLSKCVFGEPITLTVGDNVKVPSITNSNEGYYTRFYAFGSTRNIEQTSVEGKANVNKRLTLDPAKYPFGYKDIMEGLKQGEIFPKTLYFDDIYPSSKLTISDVRPRLRYRLDNNGQRIQIGGTDENPIYEQYAIWYFQIAGFTFDPTSVIEGLNLSVSFESGQLNGRDFELTYHEKSETARDANDVTPFEIKAGDYEIIIDETSGQIIPGTSYIIPQDGDMIILYNIKMPSEYTSSAQLELEAELDKAITKQLEDNNTYQTSSNPVSFYEDETDLQMGRSVNFVYLGKTLQSRIMMIEKRLDEPCNQSFSIGNKVIKGNTQQLKEEVANVNQNIDIIKAFNDLSTSLSQAYANAQREMIEGFAAIKNLWQLKQDEQGNYYAYTEYDVLGKKGITAYSAGTAKVPSIFDGLPLDNVTIWKNPETGLIEVIGGTGGGSDFDATAMWAALSAATDEQINKSHLTTALTGYATESWVQGKGYALQTSLDAVSTKLNNFLEGSDTDTIINKWKELEAFLSGMAETDNLAEILSNKADTSYVNSELTKYVTLATEQEITGSKHFINGLSVGASKHRLYEQDGIVYFDGDLAVTGGVTAFAKGNRTPSSILDGLIIDEITLSKDGGKLSVIGGVGGASNWDELEGKPSWIGDTKPSYVWSEIGNKPTTLGGYGITDAYTKTEINNGFIGYGTASASIVNNTNNKPFLYNIEKEDIGIGNGSYYSVLNVGNYSDTNFRSQLAFPYEERITDSEAYIRTANGSIWRPWRKLWHNGNFNPSNYLPLSGGIMTGKLKWNGADSLPQQTGTPEYVLCIDSFSSGGTTKWANRIDILVPSEILSKLKTVDGSSSGLDADLLDGINSTGFCRAYSSSYSFGGTQTNISTAQFITLLTNLGAFNQPYWMAKGSWFYDYNYIINDTGLGNIQLAGATVEVMGNSVEYHIRITTSPTSNNGSVTNSVFIYRNHGNVYSPNWKRIANTTDNVASATKLLNTRTIWGQNFNGEQNVTGDLYLGAGNRIVGKNSVGILKDHDNNNVTLSAAKGDLYIGYDYTDVVRFYSGNNNGTGTEKMTLLSNGNFGIGTNSPSQKLDVKGYTTSDRYIFRTGSSTDVCWNIQEDRIAAGSQIARGVNVGSLLVSNAWVDYTKVPTNGIWCKGNIITNSNILAIGGVTCYSSDQRAKTVIEQISLSLKQIANAPTIRFKWNGWKIKDDGKTHIGGIAQYMQKLLPETVLEADGMLNLDYATTGYIFAVQTAKHLVKTDTEVERLKKRVKRLEKQLKQLGYEEANIISD